MIGFIKGLLTNDGIISGATKAADAVVFTQEERAEFMLKYLEATKPMAVARRFIALAVTFLWCLGVMIYAILLFFESHMLDPWGRFMDDTINQPFSIIMGFYFLAHVISKNQKK